jgi:hypothetical protein
MLDVTVDVVRFVVQMVVLGTLLYGAFYLLRGSLRRWRTVRRHTVVLEATLMFVALLVLIGLSRVVP